MADFRLSPETVTNIPVKTNGMKVGTNVAVNGNHVDRNTDSKEDSLDLRMLGDNLRIILKVDNKCLSNQTFSTKVNKRSKNHLVQNHRKVHGNRISSTKMVGIGNTVVYVKHVTVQ